MDTSRAVRAFAALGQSTRLDALRLLVRAGPDGMAAGEIGAALGVRQNTLSANLAVLLQAGLVRNERRGRSIRYSADMEGLGGLLSFLLRDCCGGRPEACQPVIEELVSARLRTRTTSMPERPRTILFLCTANSARSILAEAIVNHEHGERFRAHSAGSAPRGEVQPPALDLLRRHGMATEGLRSKSWDEFGQGAPGAPELDVVITVCDDAADETCPFWAGAPVTAHWGVPDPARAEGGAAESALAYAEAFRRLRTRVSLLASLPLDALGGAALKRRLDEIGRTTDDAPAASVP